MLFTFIKKYKLRICLLYDVRFTLLVQYKLRIFHKIYLLGLLYQPIFV